MRLFSFQRFYFALNTITNNYFQPLQIAITATTNFYRRIVNIINALVTEILVLSFLENYPYRVLLMNDSKRKLSENVKNNIGKRLKQSN